MSFGAIKLGRFHTSITYGMRISSSILKSYVKKRLEWKDKGCALELLMKHFGLLKPKAENKGIADVVAMLQAGRERVRQSKRLPMETTNW